MKLGRINSPDETTDPHFSESISLVVCPFLGLNEDPGTSLGYPHSANLCHRLEQPVGIDLAHQNRYCLCDNYARCYVYGQAQVQSKPEKAAQNGSSLPSQAPEDSELLENEPSPNRRGVRVFGLLLMLLLILLAAIIWWPPPGTSLQDFVVLGSPIVKETAELEEASSEINVPSAEEEPPLKAAPTLGDESTALVVESAETEPVQQNVRVESSPSEAVVEAPEKTAGSQLTSAEQESPAPEETVDLVDENTGERPESDTSAADLELLTPETAVPAAEEALAEEQVEAVDQESSVQPSNSQIVVPEQSQQAGAEEVIEPQAGEVTASETETVESAPGQSQTTESPAAVATTYIGPIADGAGLQGTSAPPPLLFLLRFPGDGAEVLAILPERQPVTVLGRNSSSEWLLVRLASGVEGWVHARESGATIVLSNLPVMDGVSGDASRVQSPEPAVDPAPANEGPAPEAGAAQIIGTAVINSGALNLRSGPGLEYDSIGVAYNGQQVSLLEPLGSKVWVQIRLADGKAGWVNSNYLIQIGWAEG